MAKGRKRKAGAREPSGKLSRAIEAQDAHREPIAARMRRYGLIEEDARSQMAATYLGRLRLLGQKKGGIERGGISEDQYEAGVQYAKDDVSVAKALMSPRGLGVPEDGFTASGDDERYTAFCRQVIARHKAANAAVASLQERDGYRGKTISDALRYIVLSDLELPHLVPGLKLALDELAVFYFTAQRRRAA